MTKPLFDAKKLQITIQRMAQQIVEKYPRFENLAIIGLQPRGIHFSKRIVSLLKELQPDFSFEYGELDISFYRDDYKDKQNIILPKITKIDFSLQGKNIILIDDVLYTGRTIRAALEALVDYGRPDLVELMVLIDRRFSRELPIQPDYTGLHVDSLQKQKVRVLWNELDGKDEIIMV